MGQLQFMDLPTYHPEHIYLPSILSLPSYLHTYLRTYVPTYLRTYLRTYVRTYLSEQVHCPFTLPFTAVMVMVTRSLDPEEGLWTWKRA